MDIWFGVNSAIVGSKRMSKAERNEVKAHVPQALQIIIIEPISGVEILNKLVDLTEYETGSIGWKLSTIIDTKEVGDAEAD